MPTFVSSLFSSSSDLRAGVAALTSELHSPLVGRFARMPSCVCVLLMCC